MLNNTTGFKSTTDFRGFYALRGLQSALKALAVCWHRLTPKHTDDHSGIGMHVGSPKKYTVQSLKILHDYQVCDFSMVLFVGIPDTKCTAIVACAIAEQLNHRYSNLRHTICGAC